MTPKEAVRHGVKLLVAAVSDIAGEVIGSFIIIAVCVAVLWHFIPIAFRLHQSGGCK